MFIVSKTERQIIIERTKAGLASAKARGRTGGRPKGMSEAAKAIAVKAEILYNANKHTTDEICKTLKIGSKTTLYRYLRFQGVKINPNK